MKAKIFKTEDVAEIVGKENNNPSLAAALNLYLIPVERAGFKIVKEIKES